MIGIPLFYTQELQGFIAQFRDNFNDNSLYWAWNTDETDANREVTELATGKLRIRVINSAHAKWRDSDNNAPKVVMGGGAYPLEIKTRMESVSLGINTQAGLYISGNPGGLGSSMFICRWKTDSGFDGLVVFHNEKTQRYSLDGIIDDPIFFRVQIGNWTWDRKKIIFAYSANGISWTPVYTEETGLFVDVHTLGIGMYVANDTKNMGVFNNVSAEFDYFRTRTKTINIT